MVKKADLDKAEIYNKAQVKAVTVNENPVYDEDEHTIKKEDVKKPTPKPEENPQAPKGAETGDSGVIMSVIAIVLAVGVLSFVMKMKKTNK